MDGQLSITDIYPKQIPIPLLVKDDSLDGWIYICPTCKTYNCGGDCKCGQAIDRNSRPIPYRGKHHY